MSVLGGLILRPVSGLPTDGFLAYYPFNGNADDESGNGNDGIVNGTTLTTDRHANSNSAYSYNGSTDYIDYLNAGDGILPQTGDFTVAVWIDATVLDGAIWAQYAGAAGNGRILLDISSNKIRCFLGNDDSEGSIQMFSLSTINEGQWYFIILTRENKTFKLYLDNVLQNTQIDSGIRDIYQDGNLTGIRAIGGNDYLHDLGSYYEGKIDDLRIYNRELTSDEMTALFNE